MRCCTGRATIDHREQLGHTGSRPRRPPRPPRSGMPRPPRIVRFDPQDRHRHRDPSVQALPSPAALPTVGRPSTQRPTGRRRRRTAHQPRRPKGSITMTDDQLDAAMWSRLQGLLEHAVTRPRPGRPAGARRMVPREQHARRPRPLQRPHNHPTRMGWPPTRGHRPRRTDRRQPVPNRLHPQSTRHRATQMVK